MDRPSIEEYFKLSYVNLDIIKKIGEYALELEKAITAIEGLTFDDVIVDDKIGKIYRFAHIARGACQNDHEDWHKELDECLEALEKMGITSIKHTKEDTLKLHKEMQEVMNRKEIEE